MEREPINQRNANPITHKWRETGIGVAVKAAFSPGVVHCLQVQVSQLQATVYKLQFIRESLCTRCQVSEYWKFAGKLHVTNESSIEIACVSEYSCTRFSVGAEPFIPLPLYVPVFCEVGAEILGDVVAEEISVVLIALVRAPCEQSSYSNPLRRLRVSKMLVYLCELRVSRRLISMFMCKLPVRMLMVCLCELRVSSCV